jgi:hypothetical protein
MAPSPLSEVNFGILNKIHFGYCLPPSIDKTQKE